MKQSPWWAAFNKAGQVYELAEVQGLPDDEITKACGISKSEVARIVHSYKAMHAYFEKYPDLKLKSILEFGATSMSFTS